jgi:multidrug efflux system membrane fusion protein
MSDTLSNMLKDRDLQISSRSAGDGMNRREGMPDRPVQSKGTKVWWVVGGLLIVALAVVFGPKWLQQRGASAAAQSGAARGRSGSGPVPVVAGTVATRDVPIYLDGLGTVQAFNTVTIRARVDGAIDKILFTEGQDVQQGDLLAQIDPAPFQAQLAQNVAKKQQDQAQLAVAKLNLKRDADLLTNKILAQQDYDTQEALVEQLDATVKADQAAIDSAQVQLNYTEIRAPLNGRVGLRLVDPGNIVHANDSNGIVVITQLRPISVVFTLPEKNLDEVRQHFSAGDGLTVLAVDRNNRTNLGEGKLSVINNQIDTTTGTVSLKATFPNDDLRLWPGQFVNARLLTEVQKGATVVPVQVVQRGPDGAYAFVIQPDSSVEVRPIKVGATEGGQTVIEEGLQPGEQVVVDGQYKLQRGSKVKTSEPSSSGKSGGGATRPKSGNSIAP